MFTFQIGIHTPMNLKELSTIETAIDKVLKISPQTHDLDVTQAKFAMYFGCEFLIYEVQR